MSDVEFDFNAEDSMINENQRQLDLLRQSEAYQQLLNQQRELLSNHQSSTNQVVSKQPCTQQENLLLQLSTVAVSQHQHVEQQQVEQDRDLIDIRGKLVEEIVSYPVLWNTSLRSYKDINKKHTAWKELSKSIGASVDGLKKEWEKLKENFRKCLSKRDKLTRSGAGVKKLPTCNFFTELTFLRDSVNNRQSDSNIPYVSLSTTDGNDLENNLSNQTVNLSPSPTLYSPSPCPSTSSGPSSSKRKKKEPTPNLPDPIDAYIVNKLDEIVTRNQTKSDTTERVLDDNEHFCMSLVRTLRSFDRRKNMMARIRIQECLYQIEYNE